MAVLGNYLVVKCEQCGKKYGTSPEKLKKKEVTFPCKECGNTVTAIRPDETTTQPSDAHVSTMPDRDESQTKSRLPGMGLTTKFLIFTILPLLIISVAVVFIADNRMRNLQKQTIDSSTQVVKNISESLITQISETVARQSRQYLFSHPDLRKENFNRDIYFKKVVLQKIGLTGSTSLYEVAGDDGAWLTWADNDPSLVGENMKGLTGKLGAHFQQYWNVITGVKSGEVTSGVYKWPDAQGTLRDRFAVITPVEGTPFAVSASIFMDEITAPLQKIEEDGNEVAEQIRITLMVILGGGLLLIFILLLFYGRSLTSKITRLAQWADAISLGRLDTKPVRLRSGDEIGELAEAITRMQDSIRISIQRLSRRRR
jgi:HAMP domain-containing protein